MKQNRHTVDQIIAKLRRADVELGKGKKVPEICRLLEVTEQTYYRMASEVLLRIILTERDREIAGHG
jgi:putative transposase